MTMKKLLLVSFIFIFSCSKDAGVETPPPAPTPEINTYQIWIGNIPKGDVGYVGTLEGGNCINLSLIHI